jgi:hypothetical protein
MRVLSTFLILSILITCSKKSVEPDEDSYRYKYPNYRNGNVGFYHSFYGHDCDDSTYWNGEHWSKEFSANDSLFLLISEEIGLRQETPHLTKNETASIECSNGDQETVTFNLPYPPCTIHIDGVLLRFGFVLSKSNGVENHDGLIDIQGDSIVVVAKYKSYWTGRIVTDTAYVCAQQNGG